MEVVNSNNRIDYGRALMPDDGWTTSWAIGTTYSLNLEILMAVPLALFQGKYLSETTDIRNLRADMLDALDKVRERLFVFVHENNIDAHVSYNMLMSFLDQNIWNVPTLSPHQNFHPKVWLIRYEKEQKLGGEGVMYRLIVMSRNITAATDFDISAQMDGFLGDEVSSENDNIIEMMRWLMKRTDNDKVVKQLKELKKVHFASPRPFNNKQAVFYPQHIAGVECPLLNNVIGRELPFEELLIVSPFVDNDSLQMLTGMTSGRSVLVSREHEMDAVEPEVLRTFSECYHWNSMLENAADWEEQEETEQSSRSISLHAKMFIAKARLGYDGKSWNNWFVGSTNCTKAGMSNNYEALLHLRSLESGTSVDDVFNQLLKDGLISKHTIKESAEVDGSKSAEQTLRTIIYDLSHLPMESLIKQIGGNKYNVNVSFGKDAWNCFIQKHSDIKIHICQFAVPHEKWDVATSNSHSFKEIDCQLLSTFLKVEVKMGAENKVFLMHIDVEIPEVRHAKVMGEILDSEEKLMRYMLFCLDPQLDESMQELGEKVVGMSKSGLGHSWEDYTLPLYERLLLAASRTPKVLKDIDRNVERLKKVTGKDGKPLLSKSFLNMWKLFIPYAK